MDARILMGVGSGILGMTDQEFGHDPEPSANFNPSSLAHGLTADSPIVASSISMGNFRRRTFCSRRFKPVAPFLESFENGHIFIVDGKIELGAFECFTHDWLCHIPASPQRLGTSRRLPLCFQVFLARLTQIIMQGFYSRVRPLPPSCCSPEPLSSRRPFKPTCERRHKQMRMRGV